MSQGSEIGRGVHQVCPISPTLFNIYLKDLVKNCFQNMGGVKVGGRRIKCIRFADGMMLLAEEEMMLRDMLLELNDSCEQYGISLLSKNLKVRIYKTVIFPVVLYGCATWTLTLREEQRLRVFENRVLSKIFGAKRDEVTGEWRKLHNAELHELYPSPDIIGNIKSRRLRWAGHVARMGESRNAYRVLVGRPEGKRPLGRPRRRWGDNIKMDLREVGYDDRDWINLAQDRDQWRAYVRAAMNSGFLKSHFIFPVFATATLRVYVRERPQILSQNAGSKFLKFYKEMNSQLDKTCKQDNHPAHTAINVQSRFTEKHEKRIDKYRDIPPQNLDQFWDQVLVTWEDFAKDQNYFRDLVDSMPRKCQAVIDADGMWTMY
ncbi:hypothetical protein ANN_02499 [Periplaneta americana]|uniref:Reverse transcriptase domain-containing protein n=1 Tax=Periplaneta americana TaxID=6978 RepID=A0ABQ8TWF8_PERAM|nr:hypothetical protein ANN_02499 [Periplaneta americana]